MENYLDILSHAIIALWVISTIVCAVFAVLQLYYALSIASYVNLAGVIGLITITIIDHKGEEK